MNYSVKREISQVLQDPRLDLKILSKPELIVKQIEQWLLIWGKWNDKIGLTAEKDPMAVVQQHFFGSLLYRQGLGKIKNLLDIGSGAGFPGIPLKLVEPDLAITLVESQRKRAGFLQETVRHLVQWATPSPAPQSSVHPGGGSGPGTGAQTHPSGGCS